MHRYTTTLVHNLTIKTLSCVSFYTSSLAILLVSVHGPQWRILSPKPKVYWAIPLSKPCRQLCDWYNDLVDFDDVNATNTKIHLIVVPCVLIDFQCVTSVAVWIRTVQHWCQTVHRTYQYWYKNVWTLWVGYISGSGLLLPSATLQEKMSDIR